MENQGVFRLAVFGALAGILLCMIAGCAGGGDGNGDGNGGATALSVMGKVPASATSFDLVDYGSFRLDDDLRGAYSHADTEYSDDLAELGIRPVDVCYMTIAARCLSPSPWSRLVILEGTFNLIELGARFKDNDYCEDEYKGIQTWISPFHHAVALVSASCIVYGENTDVVEGCLDVIKGEAGSLHDNEDLRDAVAKLPAGVLVSGELADQAIGLSVVKKDADTLRLTGVYLCEDEAAAAALKSWYEGAMSADPHSFRNLDLGQNGKYLTAAFDAAVQDFNWPGNA